jgi:hypothetical protein
MSYQRLWTNAPGEPELRQGVLDSEEGGLGEGGGMEREMVRWGGGVVEWWGGGCRV